MSNITKFSPDVIIKMNYYVYLLVDSRNDEIFYVGKGSGNRVFEHENEDKFSDKNKRIRDIHEAGYEVKKYIVHAGMTENEAFAAEAVLTHFIREMKLFSGSHLLNVQEPHGVLLPCVPVNYYERHYAKESLTKEDFADLGKVMLVNVNRKGTKHTVSREEIINAVRRHVKYTEKQTPPNLIICVYQATIVGAYSILSWRADIRKQRNCSFVTYYYPEKIELNINIETRYLHCNVSKLMSIYTQNFIKRLY